jgi:hypothetical protein
MAQIDPNIALGFRMPQLQDPIAAAARAQEFGVNALKMQEYERGIAQENKLRELISSGADLNSPETIRQMYSISPKMGAEFEKSRATLKREQTAADKNLVDLEAGYMKNARDTLGAVGDQNSYNAWREQTIKRLPGLANMIPPQYSPQAKIALMADANKYLDQTQITAAQQQTADIAREGQRLQYDPVRQGQIAGAKQTAQEAAKREVAGNIDVTSNRKALAQAGYDVNTGKDDITDLIKKSTGSYIGKGVDISGRLIGTSTAGSEALAALEQKANAITFGLLNGKLGAGISKSDAELVASLVGKLGDGTLPVNDRLAAWNSAKNMMKNLGMVAEPTGSPKPTPSAKPTPSGKTPALPSGFTLD